MEILDIGSGPRPKGTVNVDLSPKFNPTVVADARSLPFKASVFDGSYLSHILEHVVDPENILKEVHRVLRTTKSVTIVFPNFASLSVLIAWIYGFYRGTGKCDQELTPYIIPEGLRNAYRIVYGGHSVGEYDIHHVPLSLPMLCGLLRGFGFEIESIKGNLVRIPLRHSRFVKTISSALAKIFPGRADIITIVATKI